MRILAVATCYVLALAFLWVGTSTAPQIGWPTTDLEVQGCGLIILGVIAKGLGHWQLLVGTRR